MMFLQTILMALSLSPSGPAAAPWMGPMQLDVHAGHRSRPYAAHNSWDRLNLKPAGSASEITIIRKHF